MVPPGYGAGDSLSTVTFAIARGIDCAEDGIRVPSLVPDASRKMKIHINKQSEVPVREQLREQIIFLLGTGKLPVGSTLPSVRELARQLKVHHNTVSHVYADLVREGWLITRRGSRLVAVQQAGSASKGAGQPANLDDLIDLIVRFAQEHAYSLQQVATRVRDRLLAEPPDHLLIVEPEAEMGILMREEIRRAIGQGPAGCTVSRLQQDPGIAIGAVLLSPVYLVDGLECIPSKDRRVVPLTYTSADRHLDLVRSLDQPSAVGLVSVSPAILKTASGFLAPVIGTRHSFHSFLMEPATENGRDGRPSIRHYAVKEYPAGPGVRSFAATDKKPPDWEGALPADGGPQAAIGERMLPSAADLGAIDLLFCDSMTYAAVKHPRRIMYRLLSDESLRDIASAAESLVLRATTARRKGRPTRS
jgi:DNA-binding transcriptional regulator YhcF (GntR family)